MHIPNHYLKYYVPSHWMTLLKCNVLNFTINLFKAICHHFLTLFFIEKTTLHHYQTRRRNDFHVQTTHSSTAQNCIRYYIPKLLSTLPTRVAEKIHTHSYTGFCRYVKKYFVDQYSDSCSIKNCIIVQIEYINLVGCMNEYMCIHVNMCVYVCIYMFTC